MNRLTALICFAVICISLAGWLTAQVVGRHERMLKELQERIEQLENR